MPRSLSALSPSPLNFFCAGDSALDGENSEAFGMFEAREEQTLKGGYSPHCGRGNSHRSDLSHLLAQIPVAWPFRIHLSQKGKEEQEEQKGQEEQKEQEETQGEEDEVVQA